MAPDDSLLQHHRVILCHFDSYSTALVFACWPDRSLLWPGPLPEGAQPGGSAPHAAEAVIAQTVARLGLSADEIVYEPEFDASFATPADPLRVHLLRFTTFEAPAALLAPHGAVFKPLSALRGHAPAELLLLRQVFNLIIGGESGRG